MSQYQRGMNVDMERIVEQVGDDQRPEDPQAEVDNYWLNLAAQTWRDSTDYLDSSLRQEWEHSLALFQQRHPPGSKYNTDAYKNRSRLVRPKTRAAERKHEAAAAAAFFSTSDIVSVEPGNDNDELQRISADVNQELLQYRLQRSIPWFLTCMGAYQSTMVQGACLSKQYWEYQDIEIEWEDPETREIETRIDVIKDKPCIDLHPVENARFDPGADWRDPVNSSPYFIVAYPMKAGDVLDRIEQGQTKTSGPKWRDATLADLLTHGQAMQSTNGVSDSTSRARDGNSRQDRHDVSHGTIFSTVWVREYFMRIQGKDYVFWTLGDGFLLSDPEPIRSVYLAGRRPFRLGVCVFEAFQAIPKSLIYLGKDTQAAANEIQNSRFDNVRLALNKRYKVRKGANIDLRKLTRSTPGGVTMMDDFNDVQAEEFNDVTSSAYAEQDRINVDFDELMGSFSQGSVASNRQLSETVGGMQMLNSSSDAVTEYQLRVFAETWVEPVLQDLCVLEQAYETDEVIMALAGEKADVYKKLQDLGKTDLSFEDLLINDVLIRVNVGMGATNPVDRVNKFMMGLNALTNVPGTLERLRPDEVITELFGRLGYRDGSRFFKPEEEMGKGPPNIEMMKLQQADQHLQMKLAQEREIALMDMASKHGLKLKELKARLGIAKYQADVSAQSGTVTTAMRERGSMIREGNKARELQFKQTTGREGI